MEESGRPLASSATASRLLRLNPPISR